jgi:hypothetical protein
VAVSSDTTDDDTRRQEQVLLLLVKLPLWRTTRHRLLLALYSIASLAVIQDTRKDQLNAQRKSTHRVDPRICRTTPVAGRTWIVPPVCKPKDNHRVNKLRFNEIDSARGQQTVSVQIQMGHELPRHVQEY